MTDTDVLSVISEAVRQELCRVANEEIEKLVHKFRCELGKHRSEVISGLINQIEILSTKDIHNNTVTFQINIKGGINNG